MAVLMETSLGDIAVDLYTDESPRECLNFLKLCKAKYYNFCPFHRVLKGFIAQTGDPSGVGRGGSSVWGLIKGVGNDSFFSKSESNRIRHKRYGVISMTNNGKDCFGSQFLLTLGDSLDSLDGKHSVFGEIAEESFEVLAKINEAYCDDNGRPYQDIRIRHTIILDDPFPDPEGLARLVPDESPPPTKEQLDTVRIADDEALVEHEGLDDEEVEQFRKRKLAKAQATILEMVGDIHDADAAPPENVLFVCKLNPVTTAEDLEVIFSRFGKIVSCEVIKDHKTRESLQYAFVEFEDQDQAEEAYFKMNNVLIDDRRIMVNFSQSIAKHKMHVPKRYGGNAKEVAVKRLKEQDDGYTMVFDHAEAQFEVDTRPKHYAEHVRSRDHTTCRSRDHHRDRSNGRDDRSGDYDRDRDEGRRRSRSRERDRRSNGRRDRSGDYDRDRDEGRRRSRSRERNRNRSRSRYDDRDRSRR